MSEPQETAWGKLTDEGPIVRQRRGFVEDADFSLSPDSMVGSWFHVIIDGVMTWQGCVVAEPQAARYLCQIDKLEEGAERVQRIFSLDTMMGSGDQRFIEGAYAVNDVATPIVAPQVEWRFYDSENEASAAYAEWSRKRLEEPAREKETA